MGVTLQCSTITLTITIRGVNGAANHETALAQEGVQVDRGSLGERSVDFRVYGWFPDELPSREAEAAAREAEAEGESASGDGEDQGLFVR
jgi:methylated-DNA-protein-cysteine methyltransferase-like protein